MIGYKRGAANEKTGFSKSSQGMAAEPPSEKGSLQR
jgi:hypothetical protein